VAFRAYLKHLLVRPPEEITVATAVRNFAIWFFNLLRNFVLVGLIKYFSDKTGSPILYGIHQIALVVIFLYCLSYFDQWYINLFSFLENKTLAHRLNLAVNLAITAIVFFVVNWATSVVVIELSNAHASG